MLGIIKIVIKRRKIGAEMAEWNFFDMIISFNLTVFFVDEENILNFLNKLLLKTVQTTSW